MKNTFLWKNAIHFFIKKCKINKEKFFWLDELIEFLTNAAKDLNINMPKDFKNFIFKLISNDRNTFNVKVNKIKSKVKIFLYD